MVLVMVLPSIIWPGKPVSRLGAPSDSLSRASAGLDSTHMDTQTVVAPPRARAPRPTTRPTTVPAETVWVTTPLYRLGLSTRGATIVSAELSHYRSYAAGDSGTRAQLVPAGREFLEQRIVVGADTLALSDLTFTPSAKVVSVAGDSAGLTFTTTRGPSTLSLTYLFRSDGYGIGVRGRISSLPAGGAQLLVGLGDGLKNTEADSIASFRDYAVVTKATKTEKQLFASTKPGERTVLDGPFEWAGVKSKYFLFAALALEANQPQFGGVVAVGGARPDSGRSLFGGKYGIATRTSVALTLPTPPSGEFHYDLYLGPLEHRRLAAMGHDLDDANPYGWAVFRPIIRPVSIVVVNVLLWTHAHLGVAYGWVLIFFGILIRLVLWPLNSRAMASQMRMQAVAPILKEIQTKYKNDPERSQKETLKVYREHNVNPLGGCLPMLLPWPVLLALYFVFQYTIELRGSPFLWLPDLSRFDPLYILPVVMGVSMFVLSKVGQRGLPPNPQTATMLYMMPAMMTFIFLKLSSGLNLYYLVSNLVSIPQQWMLSQKRLRDQGKRAGGT